MMIYVWTYFREKRADWRDGRPIPGDKQFAIWRLAAAGAAGVVSIDDQK
jgi:hypothetical protein